MKITFICVGQVKKACIREASAEYLKRIKRYSQLEVIEVKEESASIKMPREDIMRKEAQRILDKLKAGDYVVAMADGGVSMTSSELAGFVEKQMSGGKKGITFIVGGAFGLHKDVYGSSDMVLSLSAMTLPHDLARLILSEQVYRAFTIIRGEPYSH